MCKVWYNLGVNEAHLNIQVQSHSYSAFVLFPQHLCKVFLYTSGDNTESPEEGIVGVQENRLTGILIHVKMH